MSDRHADGALGAADDGLAVLSVPVHAPPLPVDARTAASAHVPGGVQRGGRPHARPHHLARLPTRVRGDAPVRGAARPGHGAGGVRRRGGAQTGRRPHRRAISESARRRRRKVRHAVAALESDAVFKQEIQPLIEEVIREMDKHNCLENESSDHMWM